MFTPQKFSWKVRLFVSVDLVGSTAYKNASGTNDSNWVTAISSFLKDFPGHIKFTEGDPEFRMQVWKLLGDEILFHAEIGCCKDVFDHLAALKDAIAAYDQILEDGRLPLSCKATAWVAGFPLCNKAIDFGNNTIDFLGPQIDAGFRITKFSTKRKFVISPECAYILVKAIKSRAVRSPAADERFQFRFHGNEILKGINGGAPYPLFWIDCAPGKMEALEEKWNPTPRACEIKEIEAYCEQFFKSSKFIKAPFIANDKSGILDDIPEDLELKRLELVASMASPADYDSQVDGEDARGIEEGAEPGIADVMSDIFKRATKKPKDKKLLSGQQSAKMRRPIFTAKATPAKKARGK